MRSALLRSGYGLKEPCQPGLVPCVFVKIPQALPVSLWRCRRSTEDFRPEKKATKEAHFTKDTTNLSEFLASVRPLEKSVSTSFL